MSDDKDTKVVGRTIWDVIIASSYILGGLIFIVAVGVFLWIWLDEVPTWFYIAILGSFAFIPFLLDFLDLELIGRHLVLWKLSIQLNANAALCYWSDA